MGCAIPEVLDRASKALPDIAALRRLQKASPCPGLFRIVASRDGGICRIKLPRGAVTPAQLRAVAQAARSFGNGEIEATNRANLQIRGIPTHHEDSVIAAILAAGLGPAVAGADDVRNVMVSPACGLCTDEIIDVQPIAAEILRALEATPRYHALSPKLSILLDGGDALGAVDHRHDIWLSALEQNGETVFAFGFAGHPPMAEGQPAPASAVRAADAAILVIAALDMFVDISAADPDITRFRHLTARRSSAEIVASLRAPLIEVAGLAQWRRTPPARLGHVGLRPQRGEGLVMIGAAPPLGRPTPAMLDGLAALAEDLTANLRLTPWQSILLTDVAEAQAPQALEVLEALGFLCHPADPLAAMVACSGTVGCASALADTKADARRLAALLKDRGPAPTVHLTACAKGCASARTAEATLVATGPDTYDLYRRTAPGCSGYGTLVAGGLAIAAAADMLALPGPQDPANAPGSSGP